MDPVKFFFLVMSHLCWFFSRNYCRYLATLILCSHFIFCCCHNVVPSLMAPCSYFSNIIIIVLYIVCFFCIGLMLGNNL